jgi:PKD repeat protein
VADINGGPGVPSSGTIAGSHVYADDGTYTVTITVHDDNGGVGTSTFTVSVANRNPVVATPNGDQNILEGQTINFSNLATFTDAGFDNPLNPTPANPPSITDPLNETFTYDIDWGDGRDAIVGASIADINGGPGVPSSGTIGGSHTYADDGVYQVTITVHDDNGGVGTSTFLVTVGNQNPIVVAPNGDQSILEGGTINFGNLATFTDAGFDNPNNTSPFMPPAVGDPLAESFTYDIDWGDGRDAVVGASIADLNGSPGVPSSGTISGMHTYADNGDYTVTVRVHDDNGGVGTVQFKVHVDNVEPTLTGTSNLVVSEGQTFTLNGLGVGLTDPGFDNPLNTLDPSNRGQVAETLSAMSINWGDGNPTEALALAEFQAVPFMGPTTATFPGASHTYADNGTYTVSVTVKDDDMASFVTRTFTIVVENVNPQLSGLATSTTNILEAGSVSFGINFSDPGFDNPLNTLDPSNGGEVAESFTYDVNWGDGRQEVVNLSTPDVNGIAGTPSTGSFNGSHIYADDGTYTVTLTIHDDDGGSHTQTFEVIVTNVAPIIQPDGANPPFAGTDVTPQGTAQIQVQYSDVGFDNTANPNPAAPPTITDRHHESFTHVINWGDGSIDAIHTYAEPGVYTVQVTPPGGGTPLEFTLTVTDVNQPPVLTLVSSQASLNDPVVVPQAYQYVVNWGDDNGGNNDAIQTITLMLKNPVGNPLLSTQTTVLQSIRTTGGEGVASTGSFNVEHQYLGPPNPLNPSADITIAVTVMDDNLGSDAASIQIGNPGIQVINVAIDTTPDVPRLEFVPQPTAQVLLNQNTTSPQTLQSISARVVTGELVLTSDRYLELVVISPEGKETMRYRLKDEALLDLRGLIATLPDNHYKIYLVSTETDSRRLVLDVFVRQGRVVDPADDSEGTRDRPPTESAEQNQQEQTPQEQAPAGGQVQPLDGNPLLERVPENPAGPEGGAGVPAAAHPVAANCEAEASVTENDAMNRPVPSPSRLRWAVPLAGFGLVAQRGSWSQEIDEAFDRADDRAWRRLRQAGRLRSVK